MPFQGYPHSNPYDYGQDIVEDTASGRQYGSLQEMQRQQQRDAARNAYMQSIMPGYGGGGGGGAPSGSGGSGGGALGGAYADAMGSARGANESRYNDILGQYQAMTGGKPPAKKSGGSGIGSRIMQRMNSDPYQQYKQSGGSMGPLQWRRLSEQAERTALERGGQFGGMNASQLYPREWGGGQFLGNPQNAGNTGGAGAYGQRPSTPPPVYPTYTAPNRGNQNY